MKQLKLTLISISLFSLLNGMEMSNVVNQDLILPSTNGNNVNPEQEQRDIIVYSQGTALDRRTVNELERKSDFFKARSEFRNLSKTSEAGILEISLANVQNFKGIVSYLPYLPNLDSVMQPHEVENLKRQLILSLQCHSIGHLRMLEKDAGYLCMRLLRNCCDVVLTAKQRGPITVYTNEMPLNQEAVRELKRTSGLFRDLTEDFGEDPSEDIPLTGVSALPTIVSCLPYLPDVDSVMEQTEEAQQRRRVLLSGLRNFSTPDVASVAKDAQYLKIPLLTEYSSAILAERFMQKGELKKFQENSGYLEELGITPDLKNEIAQKIENYNNLKYKFFTRLNPDQELSLEKILFLSLCASKIVPIASSSYFLRTPFSCCAYVNTINRQEHLKSIFWSLSDDLRSTVIKSVTVK